MRSSFLVLIGLAALAGCTQSPSIASDHAITSTPAPATVAPAPSLTVVDRSLVCMVNNQFMGKPQIPVVVAGRTYFGCCAMCKEKLEANEQARSAIDPVTGRAVDKAEAVIGRDADGRVLYFESADSLARYGRS